MSASKYDIDVDLGDEGTSHRHMVELVGSNRSVLDVGCASGYLAKTLTAFGNTVTGVEYDPAAAAEAEPYLERVVVADLDQVDLAEAVGGQTFDVVVFGDVLEHLRDPLPSLRAARGLLNPGGHVVVSIPNVAHGDVRMSLLLGRFPYGNLGLLDTTHLRFFTRESLQELLGDAGLVATEVRATKAPLFGTELGVRPEEIDPSVVEVLQAQPDATTYQFVFSAVPQDSSTLAAATAWELERTTVDLAQARAELAATHVALDDAGATITQLREQLVAAAGEVADLRDASARVTSAATEQARASSADELARTREHADQLRERLSALEHTRTYRWRHRALRVVGRA
jgi:SAM-dependent methyltransferase